MQLGLLEVLVGVLAGGIKGDARRAQVQALARARNLFGGVVVAAAVQGVEVG